MRNRPAMRQGRKAALFGGGLLALCAVCLGLTITKPPSFAMANEIDRVAENDPCIGDIETWPARYYAWAPKGREPTLYPIWILTAPWIGSDPSRVRVRFYKSADPYEYPHGRHLLRADQDTFGLDDSSFLFAAGTYDVSGRRMMEWTCGPSVR